MIPIFKRRLGRFGGSGNKGLPVVNITHTENGTFSITFRGTNNAVLYCDPGDGSAIQIKTLLGSSTDVVFSYTNNGTERRVRIWGDLLEVVRCNAGTNDIKCCLDEFLKFENLDYLRTTTNTALTGNIEKVERLRSLTFLSLYQNNLVGDFAKLASLENLTELFVGVNSLSYTQGDWQSTITSGTVFMQSCLSLSAEVDQVLIDVAAAGWSTCTIRLDGTNPVRTTASDAALATLLGNGCTVNVNE